MERPFSAMSSEEKEAHYDDLSKAAGKEMDSWEGDSKAQRRELGLDITSSLDVTDASEFRAAVQEKKMEDEAPRGGGPVPWGGG